MESAEEMAEIRISAALKAEIAAIATHYGQSPDEAATALLRMIDADHRGIGERSKAEDTRWESRLRYRNV